VAGSVTSPASGNTLMLLHPTADKALELTGNATVDLNNKGGVYINSSSSQAASATGNAKLIAPTTSITGNYTTSGNAALQTTITTGVSAAADPLSSITQPSTSGMTVQSNSTMTINGTQTLQPGVYNGGITLSGNANVTLQPGVYYVNNGNFKVSGNSSVSGSGVTIFTNQKVDFSGNGAVTLSPPSSGAYAGISIFQDRGATSGGPSDPDIKLSGNSNFNVTGTIYAANGAVQVTGNGGVSTTGSQIIAKTLKVTGNGTVKLDWDANVVARKTTIALVE
jgi:hypothetical protein